MPSPPKLVPLPRDPLAIPVVLARPVVPARSSCPPVLLVPLLGLHLALNRSAWSLFRAPVLARAVRCRLKVLMEVYRTVSLFPAS